jgi:superfamily II DNA/RNA helicase
MLPHNVQIVLFSATFPDEVQNFAQSFAPEANQIFLRKEEVTVEAIKQLHLDVEGDEAKYEALSNLYDCLTIGQSIVFCKVCPEVPTLHINLSQFMPSFAFTWPTNAYRGEHGLRPISLRGR